MKKSIFAGVLFSLLAASIPADDLANRLQDLAIQTACVGVYTKAKTNINVNLRYDDPPDYYTPSMLANRFTTISGSKTHTNAFYGVCFDYAQYAWYEIKKNQKKFNDAGMKGTQWYIAIANAGYPNTIILYDPVSKEKASITLTNGISLKEISRYNIYAHDGTSNHAWLWVQHNNGTWYWIDPTWTDNTGYVWWGVVENGREVQQYPDPDYCVTSNYTRSSGTNTGTRNPSTKPNTTKTSYIPANSSYLLLGYNYLSDLPVGFTIADNTFFQRSLNYISANCNTAFNQFEWICGVAISVTDWLRIPIGIGGNHSNRGLETSDTSMWINDVLVEGDYENSPEWEHKFVMEIGLQPVIFDSFYLSATYRLTGFSKSSLSFGAGFFF